MRNTTMKENRISVKYPELADGFVIVPRKILRDYLDTKIKQPEFFLLLYLFINATPYANCYVTNSELTLYVFSNSFTVDYVSKLMRSLKKKGYINFFNNQGKHSKYNVKIAYFHLSERDVFTTPASISNLTESEVLNTNPKHTNDSYIVNKTNEASPKDNLIRSNNNKIDNDINKYKENQNFSNKFSFKGEKRNPEDIVYDLDKRSNELPKDVETLRREALEKLKETTKNEIS